MSQHLIKSALVLAASAIVLTACGGKSETPAPQQPQTQIQPAENKMVVLPEGMRLASAVIHPPRAKDGFGDMETQTVGAFNGLHNLLKKQNLNLGNVMRVRAVLAPNADGIVDFDGYNTGFKKFFGTEKLPSEPLNITTATQTLPVTGQLIVLEADIAVPPKPEPQPADTKENE
jgi:enamine deaminase RidA (YjgF/YER057c/UK114 family)